LEHVDFEAESNFMRVVLIILIIVALAAGGAAYYTSHATANSATVFRVAPIEQGDICYTISATGTVEPEDLIDVGTQVAGLITKFGTDSQGKTVDFNSVVEKDSVLAYIDQTSYQAALDQAKATLAKSEADLLQYDAKFIQTEQEWNRAKKLLPTNAISETDYDTAFANYKVAEAAVAVAKAVIDQNKAALSTAQTNFDYTIIHSPVRGTIVARRVNIGQTVVASLSAPSLFLIAKDLRRMQVWAAVNEADIGRIKVDMPVHFTADSYPGETFRGKVTQIRMNATMTSNVVTYMVVITTDNSSGKLLPYMTASVLFEVDEHKDVYMVPNAALRWKPQVSQIAPDTNTSATNASETASNNGKEESASPATAEPSNASTGSGSATTASATTPVTASTTETTTKQPEYKRLWVADGALVRPLDVEIGLTDGIKTEIKGDHVQKGIRVVIGTGAGDEEETQAASSSGTTNPFMPKFPSKHKMPPPPPG
jgi:HlyD family secretion protein